MAYLRKIQCPRHILVKPGRSPYVMERIPSLKNIKESDAKIFKLNLWRKKKDRYGRPLPNRNPKDFVCPEILATEAKLRIYSPLHPICNSCRKCITA